MATLRLSKLQVTNFRNLMSDIIPFSPYINCIFGENGNGKTNILEAVYVLANRKSFRKNASFPQFLGIDGEKAEIIFSSVLQDREDALHSYSCKMGNGTGQWYYDGHLAKKIPPLKVVLINPFDSHHFHHTKAFRRQWMDHHIGILDGTYKKALSAFNTALKFKNALLAKRPPQFQEQLAAIHREMAKYTIPLLAARKRFLEEVSPFGQKIFEEIFSEKHELRVTLESSWVNLSEEEAFRYYQSELPKDVQAGKSMNGPQRDDYVLLLDGLNSYDYSSLGQQKVSYLSLLFAYIELFRYKFNSFPIVLIDDVSGELDQERWKRLISYLERRRFQVLITTANEKFREELEKIEGVNKLRVEAGRIGFA